jgi:hypothetical protein
MNNYINNLIDRNRPAAEVVRPRLPSIFEPPIEARTSFNALHLVGPLATQQAADKASDRRAPQAGQAEATAVKLAHEPSTGEASQKARMTNALSPEGHIPAWRGVQQLPEGIERTDDRSVSRQSSTLSIVMPSNIDESPGGAATLRLGTNRDIERSPHTVSPQENETAFADRRGQASAHADSQPLQQTNLPSRRPTHERITPQMIEESSNAVSPVESSAHRIVVQPRVARRDENYPGREASRSGQERPGFQSQEPPPMPTINVTIGRIEVKALPPAAAPPRPQKTAAPLMSLEEYMRRRNAGGDSV